MIHQFAYRHVGLSRTWLFIALCCLKWVVLHTGNKYGRVHGLPRWIPDAWLRIQIPVNDVLPRSLSLNPSSLRMGHHIPFITTRPLKIGPKMNRPAIEPELLSGLQGEGIHINPGGSDNPSREYEVSGCPSKADTRWEV